MILKRMKIGGEIHMAQASMLSTSACFLSVRPTGTCWHKELINILQLGLSSHNFVWSLTFSSSGRSWCCSKAVWPPTSSGPTPPPPPPPSSGLGGSHWPCKCSNDCLYSLCHNGVVTCDIFTCRIWLDKAATVREEKEVEHFRVLSCWYCFCFRQIIAL